MTRNQFKRHLSKVLKEGNPELTWWNRYIIIKALMSVYKTEQSIKEFLASQEDNSDSTKSDESKI